LAERLLGFAAATIVASRRFGADGIERHAALQMVRAATSAGANYEEARAAESRADFAHKCAIAAKELREATYWLKLAVRSEILRGDVHDLVREANELCAILAASVRTARSRE